MRTSRLRVKNPCAWVTTANVGTGLEAPIVFLVGLRLSDEDREALILANTRKIYMAATRAGQRLVFTYVGVIPQVLGSLLGVGGEAAN